MTCVLKSKGGESEATGRTECLRFGGISIYGELLFGLFGNMFSCVEISQLELSYGLCELEFSKT